MFREFFPAPPYHTIQPTVLKSVILCLLCERTSNKRKLALVALKWQEGARVVIVGQGNTLSCEGVGRGSSFSLGLKIIILFDFIPSGAAVQQHTFFASTICKAL